MYSIRKLIRIKKLKLDLGLKFILQLFGLFRVHRSEIYCIPVCVKSDQNTYLSFFWGSIQPYLSPWFCENHIRHEDTHSPCSSSHLRAPSLRSKRIFYECIGRHAWRDAWISYLHEANEIALQLPLWEHDDIYTSHAPLRCLGMVWASMFDNGALWLISGDEYRGSPGVKNKQGGFFKGKWFHFNTPNFH